MRNYLLYVIGIFSLIANSTPTPQEILRYADSGAGSPYVSGGTRWSTTNRKIWGADCSGFAQKAWQLPRPTAPDEPITKGRLTSSDFYKTPNSSAPWIQIDNPTFRNAVPGDAMVRDGHIFLVSKIESTGVVTIEARGEKYGIGYARKNLAYLQNLKFKTIRLKQN